MAVAKGQTARQKDIARELSELTAEHVLRAVETFEQMGGDVPTYKHSATYDLLIEGRRYPPKAILGLADQALLGHELCFNCEEFADAGCIART